MTRDEIVEKLKELGFNAANDGGVVFAILEKKSDVKKFHKSLKELGYDASSGYTFK